MSILGRILNGLLTAAVYPAAWVLRGVRKRHLYRQPFCRNALLRVGVFPILNHYYEPLFDPRALTRPLSEDRALPGIDWNVEEQLRLLAQFRYADELTNVPRAKTEDRSFYLNNGAFESGDADYLYNIIRLKKPSRIYEIGSGNSTLMAASAIKKNHAQNPAYVCRHVCVEPYEMPWLELVGVEVIRERVERVGLDLFRELERDDILFIDSSHVIRPQGDVVFELLELLPALKPGVIVHVHDIFSPRDYPRAWVVDEVRLYGEQYVLEAFLTSNRDWKIIGGLNFLQHHHYDAFSRACPLVTPEREPASFYMQKVT